MISVILTWNHSGPDGTTYVVSRRPFGVGNFVDLAEVPDKMYVDESVLPGTSYEYGVRAKNLGGTSATVISLKVNAVYPVPSVPTNIMAVVNVV